MSDFFSNVAAAHFGGIRAHCPANWQAAWIWGGLVAFGPCLSLLSTAFLVGVYALCRAHTLATRTWGTRGCQHLPSGVDVGLLVFVGVFLSLWAVALLGGVCAHCPDIWQARCERGCWWLSAAFFLSSRPSLSGVPVAMPTQPTRRVDVDVSGVGGT